MNLHTVVTATNNNPLYRDYIPVFLRAWEKLFPGINIQILVVDGQKSGIDHPGVIPVEPIPGVHPAFQSQCIRLLWPSISGDIAGISEDDAILTTDIDMIPMNRGYYTETISGYSSDKFICLRNVIDHLHQYPICYNIATPSTWNEIFQVNTMEDIIHTLQEWYGTTSYDGEHGGTDWNFDQLKLFQAVNAWDALEKSGASRRLVLLKDQETGFKRLDRMHGKEIISYLPQVLKMTSMGEFSDFHMLRPYLEHKKTIEKIVNCL